MRFHDAIARIEVGSPELPRAFDLRADIVRVREHEPQALADTVESSASVEVDPARLHAYGLSVADVSAAIRRSNREVGGRSVKVPLEPEVYDLIFTEGEPDGLWPVTPDARQHTRRSLYLFNKRNVRHPMLEAFDQPDTLNACSVRPVSTFAPQALILMNGPFVQEQGGHQISTGNITGSIGKLWGKFKG